MYINRKSYTLSRASILYVISQLTHSHVIHEAEFSLSLVLERVACVIFRFFHQIWICRRASKISGHHTFTDRDDIQTDKNTFKVTSTYTSNFSFTSTIGGPTLAGPSHNHYLKFPYPRPRQVLNVEGQWMRMRKYKVC